MFTSYLTKLRVGQCITVLLHRDSNNVYNKAPSIHFTSASAENTARSETVLVYNLINLAWLINCLNDQYNPNQVRRTLPRRCEENALPPQHPLITSSYLGPFRGALGIKNTIINYLFIFS